MDVLIKNMWKPTYCFTCFFSEVNTDFGKLVCLRLGKDCNKTILEDCPLVELPPGHGDIKDVSIILQWLNLKADNCEKVSLGEIIDYIENAPTVLEANYD